MKPKHVIPTPINSFANSYPNKRGKPCCGALSTPYKSKDIDGVGIGLTKPFGRVHSTLQKPYCLQKKSVDAWLTVVRSTHPKHFLSDDLNSACYKQNMKGRRNNTSGFTMLELLIVLAILAVLLGIAVNNYQRYRSRLELQQAQQVFVQTLNRARSDAKRLSQNQTVTWTDKVITIGERTIELSESSAVKLIKITGANTLTYTAPYGRVSSVGEYEFELQGRGDLTSKVYVYGVTGKVKAAQ